jgi:hypothetical protein
MDFSVATISIRGSSPYSQSRQHDEPFLEGESHDAHDQRTWRSKMTLSDDRASVVIPAHGVHQALINAAKYTKKKISGQGNATWTAKFTSGLMVPEPPRLNIDPATVQGLPISVNADGVRGSGKRVIRRFPMMPKWETTFDVWVLDPIITQAMFTEMLEVAAMFVGVGRFRPEKGGSNGRFEIVKIAWQDNRQLAAE